MIRRMMIAVLMIALACGWLTLWNARRLRRIDLEAKANAQRQVTTAVFRQVLAALGTTSRQSQEGGSFDSSRHGVRWDQTLKTWEGVDIHQAPVIDVEAPSAAPMEPISKQCPSGTTGGLWGRWWLRS
jgi:hypothetical protein